MSDNSQIPQRRDSLCPRCSGKNASPFSLAATTGSCSICGETLGSSTPPEVMPLPQEPFQTEPQPVATRLMPAAPGRKPGAPEPVIPKPPGPAVPEEHSAGSAVKVAPLNEQESDRLANPKPGEKPSVIIPAMTGFFCLIIAAGMVVFFLAKKGDGKTAPPGLDSAGQDTDVKEANYIRLGWQKDAYDVLGGFIEATDAEGKLPYILHPDQTEEKIGRFYRSASINDQDTPVTSFSIADLPEAERRMGVFLLTYDQPPQFAIKDFFRPLASLEVQYGIDQADLLLSTFARVSNFTMEPVRTYAFFKRTDDGLKLDWEVFAQTKYRLLQSFVEFPDPGAKMVFRVLIAEDVPEKGQGVVGVRTYRVMDPANLSDYARIDVRIDSEIGRALSIINWRGTKEIQPVTRTATLELQWSDDQERPALKISRFICWEFLGLGAEGRAPVSN